MITGNADKLAKELGKDKLLEALRTMLLIRNFEVRAEASYQHGYVGGFLHVYSGQEAIAVAASMALGPKDWWIATYRVHAMALVLGADPRELMAELFGRANGNALGRGGSMHMYTDRLLGGFGIVGGHVPIAAGAAFTIKYQEEDQIAVCFLGDGAVAQGAFHEALNLVALWDLPCLVVIENNQWGMGTAVDRALSVERLAESHAKAYGIKGYTCDGMNFYDCYEAFRNLRKEVRESGRPILVEMVTERFRGHSVSDPGLYRTKEELQKSMQRDPIILLHEDLKSRKIINDEQYKAMDKEQRGVVIDAVNFAQESPWPDPVTLEEGVFAP